MSTATATTEDTTVQETVVATKTSKDSKSTDKETAQVEKETQEEVNPLDRYVFMDNIKELLNISFDTENNVILYGSGGHGKSEITLDFLHSKGIEPYVLTMGTGMTVDRMFGGLDINAFNDKGHIEYLVENSFMNSEYVIFEEMLDAPDFILEQLKDILSSGQFRNGNQVFDIKTKYIICNTNKTREDFAKNASLIALMERFPLEAEVKWKTYNRVTYEKLLTHIMGGADPMLTFILEKYAKAGHVISPRIAIKSAELIASCGTSCLEFIADFKKHEGLLKDSIAAFDAIFKLRKLTDQAKIKSDEIAALNIDLIDTMSAYDKATSLNSELFKIVNDIKTVKADDSMAVDKATAEKEFTKLFKSYQGSLELVRDLINI